MKRVLVGISCVNEYGDPEIECFTVEIDDALKSRIKALSLAVNSVEAYSIETFNYSGTWSGFDAFCEDLDAKAADALVSEIEDGSSDVEIPCLKVMGDVFCWTCTPKHCGDDMAVSTRNIPLSFLDDAETHYIAA